MSSRTRFSVVVAALVVVACALVVVLRAGGWHDAVPLPPRSVSASMVVGTWRYHRIGDGASIDLTFHPDGTFTQVVPGGQVNRGRWYLQRGMIEMRDVLMWAVGDAAAWKRENDTWWMVNSRKRPGEVVIFGGSCADPDVYEEFERIGRP